MIAQNLFVLGLRSSSIRNVVRAIRLAPSFLQSKRNYSDHRSHDHEQLSDIIGTRERVGFGFNGQPCYADLSAFPFPAIRYKEDTPEIMAVREKEKGDWRHLSKAEKKELYRAQFCQTFVEFKHISTEWMAVVGYVLMFVSAGVWIYIWMYWFAYQPLPISFRKDYKMDQLQRMIELRINPITGLASNWDYEKNEWKKKGYLPNPYLEEEECP